MSNNLHSSNVKAIQLHRDCWNISDSQMLCCSSPLQNKFLWTPLVMIVLSITFHWLKDKGQQENRKKISDVAKHHHHHQCGPYSLVSLFTSRGTIPDALVNSIKQKVVRFRKNLAAILSQFLQIPTNLFLFNRPQEYLVYSMMVFLRRNIFHDPSQISSSCVIKLIPQVTKFLIHPWKI